MYLGSFGPHLLFPGQSALLALLAPFGLSMATVKWRMHSRGKCIHVFAQGKNGLAGCFLPLLGPRLLRVCSLSESPRLLLFVLIRIRFFGFTPAALSLVALILLRFPCLLALSPVSAISRSLHCRRSCRPSWSGACLDTTFHQFRR